MRMLRFLTEYRHKRICNFLNDPPFLLWCHTVFCYSDVYVWHMSINQPNESRILSTCSKVLVIIETGLNFQSRYLFIFLSIFRTSQRKNAKPEITPIPIRTVTMASKIPLPILSPITSACNKTANIA